MADQNVTSEITNLRSFYDLVGQTGKFVQCKTKKRISALYLDLDEANDWLDLGTDYQLGWWIGEGYIVLDFDREEDVQGILKLLEYYEVKTLVSKTTKGVHVYFRYDYTGTQRIDSHLACGLKCDLKVTNKGYVVLPFNFVNREFNNISEIADLPVWLTPLAMSTASERYVPVEAGKRNDAIFKQGGRLKYHGFEGTALQAILEATNILLDEPLGDKELSTIIKSIDSYQTRNPENEMFITRNDKGKITGINHEGMATYVASKYNYFLYKNRVYWYNEGFYNSDDGDLLLKATIKGLIPVPELVKAKTINDIYNLCLIDINKQYNLFKNEHPNKIAFTNGTYDFDIGKLVPHDPNHLITVGIPHPCGGVDFNHSRLRELLKIMELPKDDVIMLLDYMCTIVVPRNYKTILFLEGPTNTGKSIIGKYMSRLVGSENTTSIAPEQLAGRFYATQLRNKLFNWHGDSSSNELKNINMIKMVTGGDETLFELKGKDASTTFISFAKLMFSFNQVPLQKEESTDAYFDRLRILRIAKRQDLDNNWVQEIISSAPELLRWLCDRAYRLAEVSSSALSVKKVKELRYNSDNVIWWFEDNIEITGDEEDFVTINDLIKNYAIWCAREDQDQHNITRFGMSLNNLGCERDRKSINGKRERIVKGVKIKVQ